jgi:hypothetical protein
VNRLFLFALSLGALVCVVPSPAQAAKVIGVGTLDKDYVVVQIADGDVLHELPGEKVVRYTPELSTTAAVAVGSWTIKSADDANYGSAGKNPSACSRKKKMNGQAQKDWVSSDYAYEYTHQHWIYLKLPTSLVQGKAYTLEIAAATNADVTTHAFTFDINSSRSEAVHVNLVGYAPDAPHKAADLYSWLGDGGARDYKAFVGNKVYLYDVDKKTSAEVGQVALWKASGQDVGFYNLTRSSVWSVDFSSATTPGLYRLVVDGVGCSQDFAIGTGAYADPFKISIRGFFYMRLGQDNAANLTPPPRKPLYIPGKDPAATKVYITTMNPFDAQWSTFSSGDAWDRPNDWAKFRKSGNPTNDNGYGGHADAADKDRHLGHVPIIYDMLLPYILTKGAIGDDNAGIAESGNGIPDIIDEARYEVDFWLRVRDGKEYGYGITNPNDKNEFFQAGSNGLAAWANAANAAMLADAFRIAGKTALVDQYKAAAIEAYGVASAEADPMLDKSMDLGGSILRGRDLKMMAAAYLYNVTGDQTYEAVIQAESVCASAAADLTSKKLNQVWASAGYLLTPQPIHFQPLWDNMKAAVLKQAKTVEVARMDTRPSRRSTNDDDGYFRTTQNLQLTMVAHAVSSDAADKALFRKAMAAEADWGLGRNPANLIEMGVSTTPLQTKRGMIYMYTAGVDDGVQGTTPGQTPYCNLDDWDTSMTMGSPTKLYKDAFPADFKNTWPIGEGCFDTPWVWAHSEFTPQQTMRGKTALYGYLHGLGGGSGAPPIPTGGASGGAGAGGGAGGAGGAAGASGTVPRAGATSTGASAGAKGGNTAVGGKGGSLASGGGASIPVGQAGAGAVDPGTIDLGAGGAIGTTEPIPTGDGGVDVAAKKSDGCGCNLGRQRQGEGTLLAFLALGLALAFRSRRR